MTMHLVLSTSSPLVSVALYDSGGVLESAQRESRNNASGIVLEFIEAILLSTGIELRRIERFIADVGPGSFTGARVGVTLAKTLAFASGVPAAGVSSFDLILGEGTKAVPAGKNRYLLCEPNGKPEVAEGDDPRLRSAIGYGAFASEVQHPHAVNAFANRARIVPCSPEQLLPDYVLQPNISAPNIPYPRVPET